MDVNINQVYINTLRQAEAELAALMPAGRQHKASSNLGEGRSSGQDGEEESEGEQSQAEEQNEDEAAAAWEQGGIKVQCSLKRSRFCERLDLVPHLLPADSRKGHALLFDRHLAFAP